MVAGEASASFQSPQEDIKEGYADTAFESSSSHLPEKVQSRQRTLALLVSDVHRENQRMNVSSGSYMPHTRHASNRATDRGSQEQ